MKSSRKKANGIFSSLVFTSIVTGVFLSAAGYVFIRPVAVMLGAEGSLLDDCLIYARIYLIGIPASLVQYEFQNLFATAGKTKLGLYAAVISGVSNIILDALFVGVLEGGLRGAAAATVLCQNMGGIIPLVYFGRKNSSFLKIIKARFNFKAMLKICYNGFSELLNNISFSIVDIIYNNQLLHYAGEDGIAAYGVLMYISFLFNSAFIGYTVGSAPVISYHYGAKNHGEIRSLIIKSYTILGISSLSMFVISELLSGPIAGLFVSYNPELLDITTRGFQLFSFSFLFAGAAIFGSSFFTALNNGAVSAFISFMRTIVLEISFVTIFPLFLDLDGIWISAPTAEFCAAALGIIFIFCKRKFYKYSASFAEKKQS